ncbi:hypothetical protein QSV36_14730 [Pseudomonas sp. BCRC 81390]|uniref:hypothetical protein n=1 Tax=Pseudomonas sp. BCRC 81390 TaxID=3054778 RepID=UPI002599FE52|nr:hypothetical protein [Pseudomonas sp. BCRC 81390]MDM3886832.1 hypothetical protein [Pseudomonas sp. BCRC 81390]
MAVSRLTEYAVEALFSQTSIGLNVSITTFSANDSTRTDIMRIAFLAFPRVQLLDVVGPADVFAEAAKQLGNPRAYRVEVIGTEKGMIKGSSGLTDGFRRAFTRRLGVGPTDYRKRFSSM